MRRLLSERQTALAQEREAARQAKEREKLIAGALAEARTARSHEAAIGILRQALTIDRNHAAVREQLAARESAFEREQAEARKARELAEKIATAIASSKRTTNHATALGILEDALKLDPANAEVKTLITERRAARDEEARLARERREKATALVTKAKGLAAHEAAIEALESAIALEPADPDIKRLLGERQAALAREREAARLAKEREAAVAAAIARAAKTDSHEAAVEILEGALKLEPSNGQLQKLVGERRTARDRQREEERKAAERRERVATAIKKAKAASSNESAVALLKDALALDPDNREARALHESRTAALEKERAEAKRAKDIETARQTITGLIGKQQFDAADAALQNAEATLQVGKTFKDLKKQLAKARAAAGVPAGIATIEGEPGLNLGSPAALGGIAAVLLAVVAGGYFLMQSRTPEPSSPSATETARTGAPTVPAQPPAQQQQPTTTSSQPPTTSSSPPEIQQAPTSTPSNPPETTTAPTPAPPAPNPETSPPVASTPTPNPVVEGAIRQGRQQLARDPRRALTTVMGGLRVEPQNNDLKGILGEIVKRAKQDATNARTTALRHGQTVEANATFRDATARMAAAGQSERSRPDSAANLYWQAADLMGRANQEVTDALAKAAAVLPPPRQRRHRSRRSRRYQHCRQASKRAHPARAFRRRRPLPRRPAAKEPPAAANPSSGRGTAAPKPQDDDEALIRETLRSYQQAYSRVERGRCPTRASNRGRRTAGGIVQQHAESWMFRSIPRRSRSTATLRRSPAVCEHQPHSSRAEPHRIRPTPRSFWKSRVDAGLSAIDASDSPQPGTHVRVDG